MKARLLCITVLSLCYILVLPTGGYSMRIASLGNAPSSDQLNMAGLCNKASGINPIDTVLVPEKKTENTLSATIIKDFTAAENFDKVQLNWSVWDEALVDQFDIERSINGTDFNAIEKQKIAPATTEVGTHSFSDDIRSLISTIVYYRIKIYNHDGTYRYSKSLIVKRSSNAPQVVIFPNPVYEQLNVNINSTENTQVTITVWNASGIKTISQQVNIVKGMNSFTINGIEKLTEGIYQLHIKWPDGKVALHPFLKQ